MIATACGCFTCPARAVGRSSHDRALSSWEIYWFICILSSVVSQQLKFQHRDLCHVGFHLRYRFPFCNILSFSWSFVVCFLLLSFTYVFCLEPKQIFQTAGGKGDKSIVSLPFCSKSQSASMRQYIRGESLHFCSMAQQNSNKSHGRIYTFSWNRLVLPSLELSCGP